MRGIKTGKMFFLVAHIVLRGIRTGRMLQRTFFLALTDAHLSFVELFANGIVGKSDEDRLTKWPNTSYTSKTERIIVSRMSRLGYVIT